MAVSQWVTLAEPYKIKQNTPDEKIIVPAGSLGRIFKYDERAGLTVAFPEAHVSPDVLKLLPYPKPTVDEALKFLDFRSSHHCKPGQFQFNIKLYASPPQKYLDKYNESHVWENYNELLEHELNAFMGEDHDEGILEVVDWAYEWHTAGRSSGWLIIGNSWDVSMGGLEGDWKDLQEELERCGEEERAGLEQQLKQHEDIIIDMALGVQYIEAAIAHAKDGIKKWVESDEAWEGFCETHDSVLDDEAWWEETNDVVEEETCS